MSSLVRLNSLDYVFVGKIQRYTQTPFAEVFRTIGLQRREDIQTATGFVFGVPIYGFGRRRITKIDDSRQILQMWDSQVMTHYESQVQLPLLATQSTDPATSVIRASCSFGGNLWGLWESNDGGGTPYSITSRDYQGSTTAWTLKDSGIIQGSTATIWIARDLIPYKTGMLALMLTGTGYQWSNSTDGVTWVAVAALGTAALSATITANQEVDGGLLAVVGNEKVAVLYDQVNGTIAFYSGTTLAGAWTNETVVIPSGNGPQGVAVYIGIDGLQKLLVGTREGLYEVDTAPATWTIQKILDVPANNNNFRHMVVHQGILWFPLGVDDNSPAPIYTMVVNGDERIINTKMGLDQGDGVPAELLGPVRWMKSAGSFLFISIGGGAASRNARVLVHNGLGWHHMTRNGTANQKIEWIDVSSDDDGTLRLHFSKRTLATTSDTQHLVNPLLNPAAGVSLTREASGILDHPEFDGGMPRYNAGWLEVYGDAVNLDATTAGEYIAVAYGVNGAAASTTSLGNLLSGDLDLLLGTGGVTAGVGVSARSIQIRETFNRDAGDNTQTPTWRSMELTYFKKPTVLEAWAFVIDLAETAQFTSGGMEQVITNLKTARDSVVKVPFVYGQMTSTNVVVVPPLRFEEELEETGTIGNAARRGIVQVVVRELN